MFSAINLPSTIAVTMVNTLTLPKVIYLPAASTIRTGALFTIKDCCGNAGVSSIYLSTKGIDTLDSMPSTLYGLISTNSGSLTISSDGLKNWMILSYYYQNLAPPTPPFPYLANLIVDLQGTSYSGGGGTWTNSIDSTTWTMTNTTYDGTNKGPYFDGASAYAYIASLTNWVGNTFTIICYYYKPNTNLAAIISMNRTVANTDNEAEFNENFYFDYSNTYGYGLNQYSSSWPGSGLQMFSFVKDNSVGTFYLGAGTAAGTQTAGFTVTVGNADFCIGADLRGISFGTPNYLTGTIKRFLIYNIALTASDIANIYSKIYGT